MSKLTRKDVKLFAENCKPTLTTEFRTESADGSTASFSRDPDVIQNANFGQGWVNDDNKLNVKIFTEDLNSVCYVFSYFLKYLYENGIPEWKATTTYYEHSIARVDNKLYISLQDDNLNYDPQNTSGYWNEIPLETITAAVAGNGSSIIKSLSGNNITFKSLSVDGYGSLQDNGDQINIHILGGSGIVDAFWGQIQGTLTNQTDLVDALGTKQDNLTFDAPLSKDVNNEVSIPKATDAISGYLDSEDFATFAAKQDALSGFTHSYDTDTDTAQIYPTATNSNIGASTYPITNVNASKVNASTVNSGGLFNLNGEINIRCADGESVEIGTDGSGLAYKTMDIRGGSVEINGHLSVSNTIKMARGQIFSWLYNNTDVAQIYTEGGNELYIKSNANKINTNCSIIPDADNTYNLGSSSTNSFATTYTRAVGSPNGTGNKITFANTNGGDVDYDCGIAGSGTYGNHIFKVGGGSKVQIQPSNLEVDVNIVQKSGSNRNVGASNNKFANVYATEGHFDKINSGAGASVNMTGGLFRYLNGNALQIMPNNVANAFTLGGSEQTGTTKISRHGYDVLEANDTNTILNTYSSATSLILRYRGSSEVTVGLLSGGNTQGLWSKHRIMPVDDNTIQLGGSSYYFSDAYLKKINGSTYNPSDRNGKEDIVERGTKKGGENSLDKINLLTTYSYKYKDDKTKETHIGIMAQDLQKLEPDLVVDHAEKDEKGNGDAQLFIDVMGYCTLLTEAVQELSAKVEALETRVEELEKGKEVAEK